VDVDVDGDGPLDLTVTGSQCGALYIFSSSSSQAAGSGGGAGKATFSDLSFSSVHLRDENGLLDLSCSGGVLGSLVVEGAGRAPSATSPVYRVSLSDLTVSGALAVDTSSSLDFSMQSCFTGGVRVATGDIDGDGLDSLKVSLASCVSTGGVSVESSAALDFAADACRSASVFLKMGDIKSALPPGTAGLASSNSVRLSNGRVLGALTVLGSNSDDQVTVDRMVLSGATAVSLGGGQDRLAVVDSLFARFALFSGGNGSDELTLTRSRFVTTPIVIGFESLSS
ncbi:MAG: hypothetical protein JNG90_11655, partial [Planctomycetaceae bacterium]|nr:hypothetical protein [Planctomycetaceae bacterium]